MYVCIYKCISYVCCVCMYVLYMYFADNCKRVGVVFEDVISACEMINCQSIQVQV